MVARSSLEPPGRLVAFTDAVVAIAITVLILPLAGIDIEPLHSQDMSFIVSRYGYLVIGFAISWLVIINFWILHHRLFGMVSRVSDTLMWLNVLWLFGIAVFPFPAGLLTQVPDGTSIARVVTSLYLSNLLLISVAASLMSRHVRLNPELLRDRARRHGAYLRTSRAYYASGVFIIGIVVAQWWKANALWILGLLVAIRPACGLVDRLLGWDEPDRPMSVNG